MHLFKMAGKGAGGGSSSLIGVLSPCAQGEGAEELRATLTPSFSHCSALKVAMGSVPGWPISRAPCQSRRSCKPSLPRFSSLQTAQPQLQLPQGRDGSMAPLEGLSGTGQAALGAEGPIPGELSKCGTQDMGQWWPWQGWVGA